MQQAASLQVLVRVVSTAVSFGATDLATASCIVVTPAFILGLRNDGWDLKMTSACVDSHECQVG